MPLAKTLLSKQTFSLPTEELARKLLGMHLVCFSAEGICTGRIIETEAYLFHNDPACHAHRGINKRNAAMFGKAGTAYVYLIYGMYHCFNVVSGKVGEGEAVLIRALEPLDGIPLMQKRRKQELIKQLCSGPGKLVQAMGITQVMNEGCLRTGPIQIHKPKASARGTQRTSKFEIVACPRVGISKGVELPLRFYIKDNPFVSRVV